MPSFCAVKRAPGGRSDVPDETDWGLVEAGALLSAALASGLDWTSSAPAAGASFSLSPDSAAGASAAAPSSITASTCWLVTVSPSENVSSLITPSTVDGTSGTTLSATSSTMFSSRLTASPTFLCQAAMDASATDSGRTGTLISVAMLQLPGDRDVWGWMYSADMPLGGLTRASAISAVCSSTWALKCPTAGAGERSRPAKWSFWPLARQYSRWCLIWYQAPWFCGSSWHQITSASLP